MKEIAVLVDQIDEEIESSKDYAESYLTYKAKKMDEVSNKFKAMSEDEIRHAIFLHELATIKINEIGEMFTPPVQMLEVWDKAHNRYVEKVAWIKQMLAM